MRPCAWTGAGSIDSLLDKHRGRASVELAATLHVVIKAHFNHPGETTSWNPSQRPAHCSAPAALYKAPSLLSAKTRRRRRHGSVDTRAHTHLIRERTLMENVGLEQQSVKFLLSPKSDLNLPELTVMFGLERSISQQPPKPRCSVWSARGIEPTSIRSGCTDTAPQPQPVQLSVCDIYSD